MKLKKLGIFVACALILTGCGEGKKGEGDYKEVKLNKETTTTDSIAYLVGNMAGIQRQYMAKNDSTIDAKAFDEGFYAGLSLAKMDNNHYNQGLLMGLQAAMQMADMNTNYKMTMTTDAVASGYKAGIKQEPNEQKAGDIQLQATNAMNNAIIKASEKVVSDYAKGKDYKKEGNVYYKEKKAGNGAKLAIGSQAHVKMNLLDTKGKEIMPGSGEQVNPVMVGQSPMPQLDKVLPLLKEGAVVEILTTGAEIFGNRTPQNVKPMDVYVISIETVPASEVPTAETPDAAKPATPGTPENAEM